MRSWQILYAGTASAMVDAVAVPMKLLYVPTLVAGDGVVGAIPHTATASLTVKSRIDPPWPYGPMRRGSDAGANGGGAELQ